MNEENNSNNNNLNNELVNNELVVNQVSEGNLKTENNGKPVAIRFKIPSEPIYLYDEGLDLKPRDKVIVKLAKGKDIAEVILTNIPLEKFKVTDPELKILRKMTEEDELQYKRNLEREKEAFQICLSKIKKHNLPMKLLSVKYTFDVSRITFYFKADTRIDFRQLVRDLAAVFKTRIELRQISPREETEMFGGLGICGRRVCCNYWCCRPKQSFTNTDVKISFNIQGTITKVLGLCSRPLCCLRYESDTGLENKIIIPHVNSKIIFDNQIGILKSVDEDSNNVIIEILDTKTEVNISYEDFLVKISEGKIKKLDEHLS